jgi:hypothetical protein
MNSLDKIIATKIWPQHMPKARDRYSARREAAKRWLGSRYLLAAPIKGKKHG